MNLLTPILLKHPGDPLCPSDDSTYYLLTSKGLFVCRNEQFYRSSVPARNWPAELADHASFLEPRFPRIPEAEFARIVGFFRAVAERHHAEAAVLLAWSRTTRRVVVVVPPQEAGSMRVTYQTASVADPDLVFFGDVHSHVDGQAFASYVDAEDELNRPGLHLVVGRVRRLEPEVYVAAVVDGLRFELELADAVEGQVVRAADCPPEWLDCVTVSQRPVQWGATGAAYGPVGAPPVTDRGPFVLRPSRPAPGAEGAADG